MSKNPQIPLYQQPIVSEGNKLVDRVWYNFFNDIFNKTKFITPQQLDDASAPNNTIYYSISYTKLVYKDVNGVVNVLY